MKYFFEQFRELYTVSTVEPQPDHAPHGKYLDDYHYCNVVLKRTWREHICRIIFDNPAVGDLLYMRLLLLKIPGRSVLDSRTVRTDEDNSIEHTAFHDAARTRCVVTGDEEYSICWKKLLTFKSVLISVCCLGARLLHLRQSFETNSGTTLIEDLTVVFSSGEAIAEALRQIDVRLQLHGKQIRNVTCPPPFTAKRNLNESVVQLCKKYTLGLLTPNSFF